MESWRKELYHHGILGQKWGKKNGPPYPLGVSDHSVSEQKAGWKKSLNNRPHARKKSIDKKAHGKVSLGKTTEEMSVGNILSNPKTYQDSLDYQLSTKKEFKNRPKSRKRYYSNLGEKADLFIKPYEGPDLEVYGGGGLPINIPQDEKELDENWEEILGNYVSALFTEKERFLEYDDIDSILKWDSNMKIRDVESWFDNIDIDYSDVKQLSKIFKKAKEVIGKVEDNYRKGRRTR